MLGSFAFAIKRRALSREGLLQSGEDPLHIEVGERVPATVHRLDPLGGGPERDTRDRRKVGLLLDASRIGEHRASSADERSKLEVAKRLGELYASDRLQLLPQTRLD